MKERPILFSGPMVRAILEGRKTQTRRVVKFKPQDFVDQQYDDAKKFKAFITDEYGAPHEKPCPYGKLGDRLWVRETWKRSGLSWHHTRPDIDEVYVSYRAGGIPHSFERPHQETLPGDSKSSDGWVPSIHMPRWASRINLEITGVRVERLQDISEEAAKAEGITESTSVAVSADPEKDLVDLYAATFASLWDQINGTKYTWSSNPWVWVVEFKKINQEEK